MNTDDLQKLAKECCNAFNQPPIAPNAGCWPVWTEMCADIPAGAMKHVRDRIIGLDAMPRNFGKAVRHHGQEWMVSRGSGYFARKPCPDCDRESVGFFTAWQKLPDGSWRRFLVHCLCNKGKPVKDMLRMTKSQAAAAGYTVVPQGYAGCVAGYEIELMGTPVDPSPDAHLEAARNKDFKRRHSHLEALPEAES